MFLPFLTAKSSSKRDFLIVVVVVVVLVVVVIVLVVLVGLVAIRQWAFSFSGAGRQKSVP